MKKINIKSALNTWHNNSNTYFGTFSKALKKKYYAATYDENDNIHFSIFDTKKERFNWLVDWFTKHPDDNYSGKATYRDFKNTIGSDIDTPCAYKPISGYNGVMFSF